MNLFFSVWWTVVLIANSSLLLDAIKKDFEPFSIWAVVMTATAAAFLIVNLKKYFKE